MYELKEHVYNFGEQEAVWEPSARGNAFGPHLVYPGPLIFGFGHRCQYMAMGSYLSYIQSQHRWILGWSHKYYWNMREVGKETNVGRWYLTHVVTYNGESD